MRGGIGRWGRCRRVFGGWRGRGRRLLLGGGRLCRCLLGGGGRRGGGVGSFSFGGWVRLGCCWCWWCCLGGIGPVPCPFDERRLAHCGLW
ncbi:hypothetical protein BDW42DRAFT_158255 [Aspergillus taichungensis]|uniref:Uncharacterized protein n=1 Tax=Aspergillus taichungensis TaxID=482145 RepID=A0A2J5I9E2_9EURO|nr:hypothetical protein BDW42DRAFT_158255 [Aspergillus taichungensis]